MSYPAREYGMVIVGGGPAGIAPLLAAHHDGLLSALLQKGVAVIEQGERLGSGSIGQYAINSDSSGKSFADCLEAKDNGETIPLEETELTQLKNHPLTCQIRQAGDGSVSLEDAGRFLGLVGDAVHSMIDRSDTSAVLTGYRVEWARRTATGWHVQAANVHTGARQIVLAQNLVIATGASQPVERLASETIAGIPLQQRYGNRLMQSGGMLTAYGLEQASALLRGKSSPKVVIVGGSTSALAVAHALLNRMPDVRFGEAGVTVLHRRPLRVFYYDRASAIAEGYDEWTEDDVCPISGRVFRFAGFRLDSRELIMQARGIGGRSPEPRLRLQQIGEDAGTVAETLDQADLVIAALGYRPRALPILGYDGEEIVLASRTGPQMPMVDGHCRVMDSTGMALPNLFGIGLAAGFVPRGPLGGEASFRGQANGLWLWQHDVGSIIVRAICNDPDLHDAVADRICGDSRVGALA